MGTIECSQPASKSSWDSQDFGDISMVLKMAHFRKSTGPRWVNMHFVKNVGRRVESTRIFSIVALSFLELFVCNQIPETDPFILKNISKQESANPRCAEI